MFRDWFTPCITSRPHQSFHWFFIHIEEREKQTDGQAVIQTDTDYTETETEERERDREGQTGRQRQERERESRVFEPSRHFFGLVWIAATLVH